MIEDSDLDTILNKIKNKPGITFTELTINLEFEDRDVSLMLHKLTQQMLIYRSNNGYYDVDLKGAEPTTKKVLTNTIPVEVPKASVVKSKPEVPVKELDSKPIDSIPTLIKEKNYGTLYRTGSVGIVAYFYWKNRNSGYCYGFEQVRKELAKLGIKVLPNTICYLNTKGYLKVIEDTSPKNYIWSNEFIYPFSTIIESDNNIIPKKIENNDTLDHTTIPNYPDNSVCTSNKLALEIIDFKISTLLNEINTLNLLKEAINK